MAAPPIFNDDGATPEFLDVGQGFAEDLDAVGGGFHLEEKGGVNRVRNRSICGDVPWNVPTDGLMIEGGAGGGVFGDDGLEGC